MGDLVLASASPRRRQLLAQIGLTFRVRESDVDERPLLSAAGDPEWLTRGLALAKAMAVGRHETDALVLAADTVVVLDGEILGKPRDAVEAQAMLSRLQGRTHRVVTGVAVLDAATGRSRTAAEETRVTLRALTPEEIAAYVAGGEPLDKAGAYAVQGLGAVLVTRIEGCFYNVVGLPLALTVDLLQDFGCAVLGRTGNGVPCR